MQDMLLSILYGFTVPIRSSSSVNKQRVGISRIPPLRAKANRYDDVGMSSLHYGELAPIRVVAGQSRTSTQQNSPDIYKELPRDPESESALNKTPDPLIVAFNRQVAAAINQIKSRLLTLVNANEKLLDGAIIELRDTIRQLNTESDNVTTSEIFVKLIKLYQLLNNTELRNENTFLNVKLGFEQLREYSYSVEKMATPTMWFKPKRLILIFPDQQVVVLPK